MKIFVNGRPCQISDLEDGSYIRYLCKMAYDTVQKYIFLRHHLEKISVRNIEESRDVAFAIGGRIEIKFVFSVEGREIGICREFLWLELRAGIVETKKMLDDLILRVVRSEIGTATEEAS
jgi:hypothetical protein